MGVHHAWGRSLKDLFQRYHAALGEDQRYQNGFDCQGLWVEVEVEKSLGLNSKREIEAYGLDRFARACRERVAEYSGVQTRQSRRLGMWMDWERSYFTMTDPNISYIWGFLKICHERGWLYQGHRPMVWCLRCGTSLSQHEVAATDSYRDIVDPSLYVRFRFTDAPGEALVVWTTTPWTLPANVAAAVNPDAEYVWVELDGERHVVAEARREAVFGADAKVVGSVRGAELVGRPYATGFDDLPAQAERRPPRRRRRRRRARRGHGHRPHRARLRRRGLRARPPRGAAGARARSTRPGVFVEGYGELVGPQRARGARPRRRAPRARRLAAAPGAARAPLPALLALRHQADLPRRRRVVHPLRRDPPADDRRQRHGRVDAVALRQAHGGLAAQHGRLVHLAQALLGPAAAVLVLPGRPPHRRRLRGGAARARDLRARRPRRSCTGPGSTRSRSPAPSAAPTPSACPRSATAGSTPASSRSRRSATAATPTSPRATRAVPASGLTKADLPDHAYWEKWFPADWVSEMREQIRLWFYSQLFMSVALVGRAPYRRVLGYEKLHDETRPADAQVVGQRDLVRRRDREAWAPTSCAGCSPGRTRART